MGAKFTPGRNAQTIARHSLHGRRVHTPNLLTEVFENPGTAMLRLPFNIFGKILAEVGECAVELNDPRLNALMVRLTIYSIADPESPDYDPQAVERILAAVGGAALAKATGQ